MEKLKSLIDQLKAVGITPQVDIAIPVEPVDIEAIKALRAQLLQAGITPQIHIQVGLSESVTPGVQPPSQPERAIGASFEVVVKDKKLNCFTFTKRDGAGKPIFTIREPRIQLFQGDRFSVSAEHKSSEKDPGDGTIIGTGGLRFFLIVDCPSRPEAVGFYVRQVEVGRI